YMATLHPFSSLHHWLECHTHIMLALTWVFGAAYAYIPFENTATRPFMLPTDNQTTYYECTYDNGVSVLKLRLFMTSNIVLTFILPLTVLIFSYSAIMRKLIADEKRFRKSSNHAYGVKFKSSICRSTDSNSQNQNQNQNKNPNPNINMKRKINYMTDMMINDDHNNGGSSTCSINNSDSQSSSSLPSALPLSSNSVLPVNCHHNNHMIKMIKKTNEQRNNCSSCCSSSSPSSSSKHLKPIQVTTNVMNAKNSPEMEIIKPSIISEINNNNNNNNGTLCSCDHCHHQQQRPQQSGPCLSTNNNNNLVGFSNGRLCPTEELMMITNSSSSAPPTPSINQQLSTSQIDLRKSTPFNHRSKTIKMMFTVILLYGICWMPIKLYQFLNDYGLIAYCTERELYAMVCLYFICHWMAMANSFVNPIIYSFMSKSFRNDFSKITKTFRQTFSKNLNQLSIKTSSTQV
ncbi:hypothetical protein DERF_010753, partial [Dermatophagoides farinae]